MSKQRQMGAVICDSTCHCKRRETGEHLYDLLERLGFSPTAWHLIIEDEDPAWLPDVTPSAAQCRLYLSLQAQACPQEHSAEG